MWVQEAALSKAARRDDKAAVLATSLSQCSEALQLQVPYAASSCNLQFQSAFWQRSSATHEALVVASRDLIR